MNTAQGCCLKVACVSAAVSDESVAGDSGVYEASVQRWVPESWACSGVWEGPTGGWGAGEVSRLGDGQFFQVPSRGVWPGEQVLGQEQPPRERDLESLWAGRVHREAQQTQTFFLKNLLLPPRENPVSGK